MIIIIILYIALIFYHIKKYRDKKLFFFLIIGLFLSFITPILNYENTPKYSDISDAALYVSLTEDFSINSIIRDVPLVLGYQYVAYLIFLRVLFVFSLGSRFLFVSSTLLVNFLLSYFALAFVRRFLIEVIEINKERYNFIYSLLTFNPGIYLICLSTTRDSFILFILTGCFFYLSLYMKEKDKKNIISLFIFTFLLLLFRAHYIIILIFGSFIAWIAIEIKFIKRKAIIIICGVLISFVLMIILLPNKAFETIMIPSGVEEIIDEKDLHKLYQLSVFEGNKKNILILYGEILRKRIIENFIGRGTLSDVHYYFVAKDRSFYYSNLIKAIFMSLYNFYRFIIVIPIIIYFFILKKSRNNFFSLLVFSVYLFTLIIYTVKFGAFQPRIRIANEFLLIATLFNEINFIKKNILLVLLFSLILTLIEYLYRFYLI